MPGKAALLQFSRKVHLYFGLLVSPALLFFAFTGAYQTLSLHEAASNYQPPAFLASLGQIHKKQTYLIPVRRSSGPGGGPGAIGSGGDHDRPRPDAGRPEAVLTAHQDAASPIAGGSNNTRQPSSAPGAIKADPTRPNRQDATVTPTRAPGGQQPMTLAAKQRQHLPLKAFFLVVAVGLFTNTLTGVYMAYKYDRNRLLVSALLLAGTVLPLVLVNF
jgi:hypothetical protein